MSRTSEGLPGSQFRARWLPGVILILLFAGALAWRLVDLDVRPMHTDEAVQGIFFAQLLEGGGYTYDPTEFHGPTLYYLTLPLAWLAGQRSGAELTETTLRLLPVLFSVGLIPLLVLWRRWIGSHAVCWAALFTALSPIHLYYARYYIQESLLVFFFFGFLTCVMRYLLSGRTAWVVAAGVFAGLTHATKETSALMFAALFAAGLLVFAVSRWRRDEGWRIRQADIPWRVLAIGVLTAGVVSVTFYSSFFTHAQGVADSVLTYFHFADRATGQGHEKPWFTHLQWIGWYRSGGFVWSESFLLVLAGVALLFSNDWKTPPESVPTIGRQERATDAHGRTAAGSVAPRDIVYLLGAYGIILIALYSAIPYKTPWLMLGPMQAVALLAGVGAAALIRRPPWIFAKGVMIVVLAAGTWQLGRQAHRVAFRFAADERVPYVYSHTSSDAVRLSERILRVVVRLDEAERVVQVAGAEYWPLPWYLRSLDQVGYWSEWPGPLIAPVIVLDRDLSARAETTLQETHVMQLAGLRPGVLACAWFRRDLWETEIMGLSGDDSDGTVAPYEVERNNRLRKRGRLQYM